jgi:hypothetical protein
MRMLACTIVLGCAGCAPALLSLGAAVPLTDTLPRDVPLEVITRSALSRPLVVEPTRTRVADVEVSLGHAIASAAVPWADAHRGQRPDGWQLIVELAKAHAGSSDGVVDVALNVRATLRTRAGHVYLAQTQAHCHERAALAIADSAPLFYHCMLSVGHELGGWLGGVQP